MPDIFISYARPQEDRAHRTAEVLRRLGYGVWRDDELPAHLPYADVIEERLRASRVVLVLWSAEAVKSQWVRAEADLARQAGTLVQMSLDGSPLPMPFNQIQCADLRGWSGTDDHAGWQKVLSSVRELIEAPGITAPTSIPMPRSTTEGRLLAVMAFDNLSNDPEMTYFSDGVSEEILQTIARMPDLKVVGRSSSFQFRGKDKALANVTAQLMTTHVLDGAVRRSGDRVRISASLVECQTQTSVWSGQFDRDLSDVFALQDEIAAAIAEALQLVFAPAAEPRKVDPKAYDYYLRARALAGAWATNAECIALLEQAVALSPDFGAAWASLALARALDARWSKEPRKVFYGPGGRTQSGGSGGGLGSLTGGQLCRAEPARGIGGLLRTGSPFAGGTGGGALGPRNPQTCLRLCRFGGAHAREFSAGRPRPRDRSIEQDHRQSPCRSAC